MSLAASRTKTLTALRELQDRWEQVCLDWDDDMSNDIHHTCIEPLESQVRAVIAATEDMQHLVSRAQSECA